jgi:hypothetical protein
MGGTDGKLSISFRANSFIDISGREQVRNAEIGFMKRFLIVKTIHVSHRL